MLNNHQTYLYFFVKTDTQALLLKYLRYLKRTKLWIWLYRTSGSYITYSIEQDSREQRGRRGGVVVLIRQPTKEQLRTEMLCGQKSLCTENYWYGKWNFMGWKSFGTEISWYGKFLLQNVLYYGLSNICTNEWSKYMQLYYN